MTHRFVGWLGDSLRWGKWEDLGRRQGREMRSTIWDLMCLKSMKQCSWKCVRLVGIENWSLEGFYEWLSWNALRTNLLIQSEDKGQKSELRGRHQHLSSGGKRNWHSEEWLDWGDYLVGVLLILSKSRTIGFSWVGLGAERGVKATWDLLCWSAIQSLFCN